MTTDNLNTASAGTAIAYLMKNYAAYNAWANTTLINWLRTHPEEVLEKEISSSFSGIKPTIFHICQTQVYWLSLIKKEAFDWERSYTGTIGEAFDMLIKQSEEFADVVNQMTEADIEACTLVENPWFKCDFANFEYIQQVMNHSTYHRGQITTITHHLGLTGAPMTDYNYYNIYGKKG
ncbi:DinB family protein [Pedobacter steynii]|uniref:Damage-inducible protein DinB n=1 Tax=Pedobacter steynii TaxID=430522 RepID=A0A1D7QBV2_9SPHI|nr:DinB family protein [Pedobacter steynii]AOM76180.1 damage-inducible protein DinB [Pedobacter steynii]